MQTATVSGRAAGQFRTLCFRSIHGLAAWVVLQGFVAPAIGQTIDVTPDEATVVRFSGPEGGPFRAETATTWTVEDVDNVGLDLNVLSDQLWLDVEPSEGTLPGRFLDSTLDISAVLNADEAELLAPGVYTAHVSFLNLDTGEGNTQRTVEISVSAAHLSVSPAFVNAFATVNGSSPFPITVTVTAVGTTDLNYSLSYVPRDWFAVNKSGGTVPGGGSDTFTVFFSAYGLIPQTHTADITVRNLTNGAGTTRVPVALTVSPASTGALTLSPNEDLEVTGVAGELTPASQGSRLSNGSDRYVLWEATTQERWISISPAGGELAPNDGALSTLDQQLLEIRTNLAINDLPAGSHIGTVTFENLSTGVSIGSRLVRVVADPVLTLPADSAAGVVEASPAGEELSLSPAKRLAFGFGTAVTLTAMASEGYRFDGWVTDLELESDMENPLVVAMDASRTIGAIFSPVLRTLTLSVSGSGTGTVKPDPSGNMMENALVFRYTDGQSVNLEAQEDGGSIFAGWSGNVPAGAEHDNPLEVLMDRDRVITARFEPVVTLSVEVSGDGTVAVDPEQASFAAGSVVHLTAQPAEGAEFSGWSGDASGTQALLTVTLSADTAILATFVPEGTGPSNPGGTTFQLFVDVTGDGVVSPSGGEFDAGSAVTLVATPGVGWIFSQWEGAATGTELVTSVVMDSNKTVQAVFETDPNSGSGGAGRPLTRLCGAMGWSTLSIFMLSWVSLCWVRRRC